jgi:hypothetical protein
LYGYSPAKEVRDDSNYTAANTSDIGQLTQVQSLGFVDILAGEKLEDFTALLLLFVTIAETVRYSPL